VEKNAIVEKNIKFASPAEVPSVLSAVAVLAQLSLRSLAQLPCGRRGGRNNWEKPLVGLGHACVVAFAGELSIPTAGSRFLRFLPWVAAGRRFLRCSFRSVSSSCACARPSRRVRLSLAAWSPVLLREFGAPIEDCGVVG